MTTKKAAKPKRGRPFSENPANFRLNVRVTHEQREAYKAAAEVAGLTLTAWLEKMANRASGFRADS